MATRFNAPPNWPTPPEGWVPPPGWRPDVEWGPAPEGWSLYVEDSATDAAALPRIDETRPARSEYKVLTQKDRFFSGKFSPERLEQAINAYAEQGWRAVSMATATIPGLGAREELIVLLERARA